MANAFKNPSDTQIAEIIARSERKAAKWVKDLETGDIYYWEAEKSFHKQMADSLNITVSEKGLAVMNDLVYQAYVVAHKGKLDEKRELIDLTPDKRVAISKVRDAIASGFDYGYIKQGTETVGYYTEKSFLVSSQNERMGT